MSNKPNYNKSKLLKNLRLVALNYPDIFAKAPVPFIIIVVVK